MSSRPRKRTSRSADAEMSIAPVIANTRTAAMSTTMIAIATRIAVTNGAIAARSAMVIAGLPQETEVDRRRRLDRPEDAVDGAVDELEDETREQPEDHDECAERHQGHDLGRPHVGQVVADPPHELGQLAENDALEHPEQIPRGEDHHEGGDRGDDRAVDPRAEKDQELADEARQA